jgi:hypothetical protein
MTFRREPMVQWFFDSLHRECMGNYTGIKIVVVDFLADEPGRRDAFAKLAHCDITHIAPMPSVYQGKHRLTKVDYFAAANARNSAVCHAPDGYIVFADDLSVLMPGWLPCVRRAMDKAYVVCGTYKKVLSLVVENGSAVYYREHVAGNDSRARLGSMDGPVNLPGGAVYGCSVGMPIDAILDVNGFDTDCDLLGMGSEDSICGLMLEQRGWTIMFDARMQTLESEERHHWQPSLKRVIEKKDGDPLDASWAMLNPVVAGKRTRAPNYFGEEGLAGLRQRILKGEPFPIMTIPENNWYSGKPLSEY